MSEEFYREALERFQGLLEQAQECGLNEPTAMTLATVDARGRPAARTVLLKEVGPAGFVFYTNTLSRKGEHLGGNPSAALCFFWQPLMEQVLIEGLVEPVSEAEADAYWETRPRLSQIGAWASLQSQPLQSRQTLEQRFSEFETRFEGMPVPRPPHWSGYRIAPDFIEFWSSRPGRLHERTRYTLGEQGWQRTSVYP
mgnify:CR=1 FL=1